MIPRGLDCCSSTEQKPQMERNTVVFFRLVMLASCFMSESVCSLINLLALLHLMSSCHCLYANSQVCLFKENKRHTFILKTAVFETVNRCLRWIQTVLKVQTVSLRERLKQPFMLVGKYLLYVFLMDCIWLFLSRIIPLSVFLVLCQP